MQSSRIWLGMEVYIDHLRLDPAGEDLGKREEGLEGFVVRKLDDYWVIKHDGTYAAYFADEIEPIAAIYWYKVKKFHGYC